MKHLILATLLACTGTATYAQDRIWRCGTEYTSNTYIAQQRGCKELNSGRAAAPALALPPEASAITVQVDNDGHFRMRGTVNGQPAIFLVDTGATFVSVSDELARRAHLQGGAAIQLHTGNGMRDSWLVEGVNVMAGALGVPDGVKVAVGPTGTGEDVLLGQSFLSHFEITMNGKQLVIRDRTQ